MKHSGQQAKAAHSTGPARSRVSPAPARIGFLEEMIQFATARRQNKTGGLTFDQWLEQRQRRSFLAQKRAALKACAR
ncbi:MAG: hypothetical protein ABMA26_25480 [Limisphaerales bacterium]